MSIAIFYQFLPNSDLGENSIFKHIFGTLPVPKIVKEHFLNVDGEAQSAESRADFVHKMRLALKELRETRIWLLIIVRADLIKPASKLDELLDESNRLISIFVKSIGTAKKNKDKTS